MGGKRVLQALHRLSLYSEDWDRVFMKISTETGSQDTRCVFAWPSSSVVAQEQPWTDLWWWTDEFEHFLLMNSEDLYHQQSLAWESNQSWDFFAPFIAPCYASRHFKQRFLEALWEAGQCCITPMEWDNYHIFSAGSPPFSLYLFSFCQVMGLCSQHQQPWEKSLCNIIQRLNQI